MGIKLKTRGIMMKKILILLFLVILIIPKDISASTETIEIIQIEGDKLIINQGSNQGIKKDTYYLVIQNDITVAKTKVIDARNDISALKILSSEFGYKINIGDKVLPDTSNMVAAEDLLSQINSKSEINNIHMGKNPYSIHKKIGGYGALASYGLTILIGGLMWDYTYSTTVIPIIGPVISIIRVENNPFITFMTGGKELFILSSAVQTSFTAYFIYALVKSSNWESRSGFSVEPSQNNIGISINYKF